MRVLVTGATGFIGRALTAALRRDGHAVVAWVRSAGRARGALGAGVDLVETSAGADGLAGALAQMLPPFRVGAGGPVGTGRQYMPWIHLTDVIGIIRTALTGDAIRGPINAVAPNPVTSREFAAALGRALRRPAFLPMPPFALRAVFGEAAAVLLTSQRVDPAALRARGFRWTYRTIDAALADLVNGTLRRSA